jgi:hypothetical protein
MDPDLYTITQALGEYHDSNARHNKKLPPLHNLLYASKSAYEGSLDRYKKEECARSIKQHEFKNYLASNPNHKVGIFMMNDNYIDKANKASVIILSYIGNNQYFVEWKVISAYFVENELERVRIVNNPKYNFGFADFPKEKMYLDELLNMLFITLSIRGNGVNIYENTGYYIRFDVLTTYNIFTNRSSCVKLIKDYSKDLVLGMIDDDLRKLVVEDKIHALNLYLYMNARIFDIEKNYPGINIVTDMEITDNIEQYISETEDERHDIFDAIITKIKSFA